MLLGKRLGVDPQVLADIINNSTGRCWSSEVSLSNDLSMVDRRLQVRVQADVLV
jgi:3-hydroxyisobutyrate dehydrogenase